MHFLMGCKVIRSKLDQFAISQHIHIGACGFQCRLIAGGKQLKVSCRLRVAQGLVSCKVAKPSNRVWRNCKEARLPE